MLLIIVSCFLGAWAGFFVWGKYRKWSLISSIGGGFIGAVLMLIVILQVAAFSAKARDVTIQECAEAIDSLHLPAADHDQIVSQKCGGLSHEAQDQAAELATKQSGKIVFLPPYTAH